MEQSGNTQLVWLLLLGVAVVGSNSLALSPILNDVAGALGTSPVTVARANAAYGAAAALSALLLGRLIDRMGAGVALVRGLLLLALAMLGSATANHWLVLAGAQAAAGVAAGLILPATYALATSTAPPGKEAQNLGRVLSGWSVSLVAGVPFSALVASLASWRLSFGVLAVPLLVAAWLLFRLDLRDMAPKPAGTRGRAGMAAVLWRPAVVPLLLICLLFMTAFYGAYAYLGDHARKLLSLSAGEAGLIVLSYGLGFGLAAFGDRLVDRWGATRLFPGVMAAASLIYAAMIPGTASWPALLALAGAWGFANHFGLNILVLLLSRTSPDSRGTVLALNSAVTYAGASLGAGVLGQIYDGSGYGAVAGVAAILTAVAAAIGLLLPARSVSAA